MCWRFEHVSRFPSPRKEIEVDIIIQVRRQRESSREALWGTRKIRIHADINLGGAYYRTYFPLQVLWLECWSHVFSPCFFNSQPRLLLEYTRNVPNVLTIGNLQLSATNGRQNRDLRRK